MDWVKKNRLLVAVAVLAVLVGLTFLVDRDEDAVAAAPAAAAEIPDLSAAEIDELSVRRPGDEAVRLAKKDGVWRVVEPVDADAEATTVQAALDKLAGLEVSRVAATNADNHERLDVTDEKGVHVVAKQAGETLLDLIVGSYGGGETMVRLEGEDAVLAVRGSIRFAFDKAVKDWRNRRIADLPSSDVVEIAFTEGETTRRFVRGDDDTWAQAPGDAPIEGFTPSKVNSLVGRLAQMRATDFAAPDVGAEAAGLAAPAARVVLRYRVPKEGDAEPTEGGESADGEATEGAEAEPAPAEIGSITLLLGSAVDGETGPHYVQVEGRDVIYQISQSSADGFRPTDEDFVQPPPEEAPEGADAPPPALGGGPGGDIPPELMRQIQEQMKAQGMGN